MKNCRYSKGDTFSFDLKISGAKHGKEIRIDYGDSRPDTVFSELKFENWVDTLNVEMRYDTVG
ncbi:hypothetical protein QA601_07240 [Chitinispirillales bacterium ANBcel5]|uniref:hypothetical protein n=1 Tax=Cellulosispirillum alkaliphilum TaxID=3039283 RepID=UPI002A556BB8|nr:hypothetical protein [Chitinispirillales bacterium ANBcel5]